MRRFLVVPALAAAVATGCGDDGTPGDGRTADAPARSAPAQTAATAVATVTPSAIAPRAASGEVLLVDVREDEEWAAGRSGDAVHVPLARVERDIGALREQAAGRPIAFICRTGRRSAQAARIAVEAGVREVINVRGGMSAWVAAGLPLVPEDGTVT